MKVGLVYTSTTPELIQMVEDEVHKQLGQNIELASYQDPSILQDAIAAGHVTAKAGAKLISLYTKAIQEDADIIYNLCSSVGEVADAAQDMGSFLDIPIVRVDEKMCMEAVLAGKRIGVMATLPTTLNPTKNTIINKAKEAGKGIILVDGLLENAFGLDQEAFKAKMLDMANRLKPEVDVLLFAQGSMAYCHEYVEENTGVKVFSSPGMGAKALASTVIKKSIDYELNQMNKKLVVLDDDPTGIQTVHGINVYTKWDRQTLKEALNDGEKTFFLLTNSRGLTQEETRSLHKEIAENLQAVSKELGKDYLVISRGDSTLRGHYPLETETLKEVLEANDYGVFDGEILCPFFPEGGRLTKDGIHYIVTGKDWLPAGDSEFAKDPTFGYSKSHLGAYIEEKTKGQYLADSCLHITLDQLSYSKVDGIRDQLMTVKDFNKVIVDATSYEELSVFVLALLKAINQGKNFMIRSAAALPKVMANIESVPYLSKSQIVDNGGHRGGLVMVGSHVKKTTDQLEEALRSDLDLVAMEFDVSKVSDDDVFEEEIQRIVQEAEETMKKGQTVVVFTSRKLQHQGQDKEEALKQSVKIAAGVTAIVERLSVRPRFIIAKGGITSSEIGTKALSVVKAKVLGQIMPGIPVWQTGQESKFPGMSYVIFPGNVGQTSSLKDMLSLLI